MPLREPGFGVNTQVKKTSEIANAQEQLEESYKMISKILKREAPLLARFAGDSSLHFKASIEAETFAFYPKTYEIEVPVQWFIEKQYSPDQIKWALYHELSHFIDMRKNPKEFNDNFEYILKEKAPQIASWIEDAMHKQGVQENKIKETTEQRPIPGRKNETMSYLEKRGYEMSHTFYNIFDDIYVNSLVEQKAPYYIQQAGREKVQDIYKKIGYADGNFKGKPLHIQFIYSLIRDEMIGGEGSQVDDEVKEIIENKKILGKTIKQIIKEQLKPRGGKLIDPGERYTLLKTFIEPIYLDFIKRDIDKMNFDDLEQEMKKAQEENRQNQNDQEQGEQEGENSEQEDKGNEQSDGNNEGSQDNQENKEQENGDGGDRGNQKQEGDSNEDFSFGEIIEYHQNEDDPDKILTEEEKQKMVEEFIRKEEYDNLSQEERARIDYENAKKEFDDRYKIGEETRKIYDETTEQIVSARKKMRKFWKKLIGQGMELLRKKQSQQKRGGNINVDDLIREMPDIQEGMQKGKGDVEPMIYERFVSEIIPGNQPERIEVSVVADMSGSMDSRKIQALRQAVALLLLSLEDFNDYLNQIRKKTKTKLVADSEVYVFGTDFDRVKNFDSKVDAQNKNKEVQIIKVFDHLQKTIGSTRDIKVLSEILSGIDRKTEQSIKKKKLKKIVFEITDGSPDPDTIEEMKEAIRKLKKDKGIITIAFKIGENQAEKAIFQEIWNGDKNEEKGNGIYLGDDIESLPEKLLEALKNVLKDVRI
jgi:uncharacterized protein YegL